MKLDTCVSAVAVSLLGVLGTGCENPPKLCSDPVEVTCGDSVNGDTTGGPANFVSEYSCIEGVESGPEAYFVFRPKEDEHVTANLGLLGYANLDLIVVGAKGSGDCDPRGACLGAISSAAGSTQVAFDAEAGKTYYLIVDGEDGAQGPFDLNLNCDPEGFGKQTLEMPESSVHEWDLLFVVDDTQSMANEQQKLKLRFNVLMDALRHVRGGLPGLHIGVVTSDLGAWTYQTIEGCGRVGGDKGILGQVGGLNNGDTFIGSGQHYLVDVEPKGCQIDKEVLPDGVRCNSHDCTQANCDQAVTPGSSEQLTLYVDGDTGCPRCRNYSGNLEDVFSDYANVGTQGCGFTQPLEAMRKALDPQDSDTSGPNAGFLRNDAYLGVVWVTDKEDCSAIGDKAQTLFDPSQTEMDSALGPLTPFRCFEFGVTCDENDRTVTGPRGNCRVRDEVNALLTPIARYTAFLESTKAPTMLALAGIAGPFQPGDLVNVTTDGQGWPKVDFSCLDPENSDEGGLPAIRLRALLDFFNGPEDMDYWAFSSICASDFSSALQGIGAKLGETLAERCLGKPFAGCPNGPQGTQCSPCLPDCTVFEIEHRDTAQQAKLQVPWCGQVCRDGLCTRDDLLECSYDTNGRCTCPTGMYPTRLEDLDGKPYEGCAPLLYPNADPEQDRDPTLASIVPRVEPSCYGTDCPEGTEGQDSACWYLTSNTNCNFGAGLRVVRASDPPPGTFVRAFCAVVPSAEQLCNDGQDEDQDCLTDEEDPDCSF